MLVFCLLMAIYKLKEVMDGKPVYGAGLPAKNKGCYKYLRQTDITNNRNINTFVDKSENKFVNKKDLLISRAGANAGTPYYHDLDEKMVYAGYLVKYPLNKKIVSSKFIFYYLMKHQKVIKNMVNTGSTMPKFNPPVALELNLDIPKLKEQLKIIDIIEQREDFLIRHINLINLETYENAKKSINRIIDIIEPLENQVITLKKLSKSIDYKIFSFRQNDGLHDKVYNLAKIRTGKRNADHATKKGEYNFYTCSEKISKCNQYSFDEESLLVAGNGNVGNTKYYKGKFDAYQRTYVINFEKYTGTGYLAFLMNKSKLESYSQGSVIKYLVLNDIRNIDVIIDDEINNQIIELLRFKQKTINLIAYLEDIKYKTINLFIQ